jgi:hypothetical protein
MLSIGSWMFKICVKFLPQFIFNNFYIKTFQLLLSFQTTTMMFKVFIFTLISSFVLTSLIPETNGFEVSRVKRHVSKKIDENPKNHTKKTTNPFAETVHTTLDPTGLRAKRQIDDVNLYVTDYTISTAFDEDFNEEITTPLTTTMKPTVKNQVKVQAVRPNVKLQVKTMNAVEIFKSEP